MADDDMFMDSERLKKMIALGIYDDKTVDKMRNIKNSDFRGNDSALSTRPPVRTESTADKVLNQVLNRTAPTFNRDNSGRGRGGTPLRTQTADQWRPPNRTHGFRPLDNSAFKWSEVSGDLKRRRSPSPNRDTEDFKDGFRSGIRDGIQTKIQRNEIERKLNIDFIKDKNSGNSCIDRDFRPKSDTDQRIGGDTDFRPKYDTNVRKNAHNLPLITSTANDEDFRRGGGNGRGNRRPYNTNTRHVYGSNERSGGFNANKSKPVFDDIDDFIEKASMKLDVPKPSPQKGRGGQSNRGRGTDRRPNQSQRTDNNYNRSNTNESYSSQSNDMYNRRAPEDRFDSGQQESAEPIPQENPSKHISILRETVEELAKSNLYCQYCDCYLSSLVEVNTHIGTVIHQQNMAKKIMEDNEDKNEPNIPDKPIESPQQTRPKIQTTIERVPIGMAAIVQMIEQRKQITLKSLTEMDNYEITTDSEASLAKELAKLLTNELLNYKMNLMPDTVKQALKHQGIGLLNAVANT